MTGARKLMSRAKRAVVRAAKGASRAAHAARKALSRALPGASSRARSNARAAAAAAAVSEGHDRPPLEVAAAQLTAHPRADDGGRDENGRAERGRAPNAADEGARTPEAGGGLRDVLAHGLDLRTLMAAAEAAGARVDILDSECVLVRNGTTVWRGTPRAPAPPAAPTAAALATRREERVARARLANASKRLQRYALPAAAAPAPMEGAPHDVCAICLDECVAAERALWTCTKCDNSLHAECFEAWSRHQHTGCEAGRHVAPCVYCRNWALEN